MTRGMMIMGAVILGGATMISQAQDARSQQLIHQPDDYLPRLVSADVLDASYTTALRRLERVVP